MAKLVLRDSCYNGIKDIKKNKIQNNLLHKEYVKETNKRIERNKLRYAIAYRNAMFYLAQ